MRQNVQLNDPIGKAIFKKFERVTENTVLGLVARILEIDEFVGVVDETDRLIGAITHIQLLDFIASGAIVNGTMNLKI